jgi:DNA-binding LytR/AlgR family response regulator
MKQTYIIIDDDPQSILKTQAVASRFEGFLCVATAQNYDDAINVILEHNPKIIFLEIDPSDKTSNLSLLLINELHRYLKIIPKIIVVTKYKDFAYEAVKYDVLDYYTKPLGINELRKSVLKMDKMNASVAPQNLAINPVDDAITSETFSIFDALETTNQEKLIAPEVIYEDEIVPESIPENIPEIHEPIEVVSVHDDSRTAPDPEVVKMGKPGSWPIENKTTKDEKPLIICVKSYSDYRFIEATDICYLKADNNSTDIHLHNGEMITAFKTMKNFEMALSFPFVRIHNSYIVNIDYVSRIHTGNAVCYIKKTAIKLPFSKSYKENVDAILSSISKGNYLEI